MKKSAFFSGLLFVLLGKAVVEDLHFDAALRQRVGLEAFMPAAGAHTKMPDSRPS